MKTHIGEVAEREVLRPWAEATLERVRDQCRQRFQDADVTLTILGVRAAALPDAAGAVDVVVFLVRVPKHPGMVFLVEAEFDPQWRQTDIPGSS